MIRTITSLSLSLLITVSFAQEKKDLTLQEIWASWKFGGESVRGVRSMNDGIHYTSQDRSEEGTEINKYSYQTGEKVETLVVSNDLKPEGSEYPLSIEGYSFSADESKLMIATGVENIYRHSTRETNYVYDLKSKKLTLLSEGEKQRYATFSPAGTKVAFVRGNDMWVKDLEKGKETQLTTDGKFNHIINGATDWVYEEEFAFDKAFFWSPDGQRIAYYRFDESAVKEFNMAMYGSLYPEDYRFKYPKCGEDNAKVSIHIYNLKTGKTVGVNLGGDFEYIARVKWTKDPKWLSLQRMNRHQSRLELMLADAATGQVKVLLAEDNDYYIDVTDDLTFLDNKQEFIWTSEKDGFNHIYLYSMDGKLVNQVTKGNWDVTGFSGIDEGTGTLYFTSAEESPMQRHIYSISKDGSNKKKLTTRPGWNRASFSNGNKFFINYHSDRNTPSYITLNQGDGKEVRVLKTNEKLNNTLTEYNLSKSEFFSFKTSEKVELNGWMIKPPDFDKSKKYPVLMFVYGGPGSQTVKDQWGANNYLWYQMLAQQGFIIASVDNRGTGARGEQFKKMTYKQLGKYETVDQIESAKHLASLPYVDSNRIGIWGWSYGGYMSSNCLAKGADVFKTAMAVAPVTNWRYYDSIYTERYMQTPQENPNGYDDNSPINHVSKIKGKYLLVHGTADDNVHYQNTVEMVTALNKANIQYDLAIYPNKNHGIYGGNTRLHLYTKMTNFLLDNLKNTTTP